MGSNAQWRVGTGTAGSWGENQILVCKGFSSLGGGDQFILGINETSGAWLKVRADMPSMRPLLNGATIEVRKEIAGYQVLLILSRRLSNLLTRLVAIGDVSAGRTLKRINFLNISGDIGFFRGLREKRDERDI